MNPNSQIESCPSTNSNRQQSAPTPAQLPSLFGNLYAPVDIAALVYFRFVFGAVMLWEVIRYFQHGWIERYYIRPDIFFHYFGFSWVHAWPGTGMYWHFVGLGVLAVCIMLGFYYRLASVLFFLGFTYVFLLDQTNYLNHFYLISLISFLNILLPSHHAVSLDAGRHPELRTQTVPTWSLWLLRFQLAVPYVYGGIAKLNMDWLHGEPIRMWMADRADSTPFGNLLLQEWFVYGISYGGILFDLLIVPLVFWRKTRIFAVLWLAIFHLSNAYLFSIGIFPWLMLAATPVFFPPSSIRKAVSAFGIAIENPIPSFANPTSLLEKQRAGLLMMGIYVTFQLVFPFRHLLYPGNSMWTEEGHRFSWHMKLRDKSASAMFTVEDIASGYRWTVDPDDSLTQRQASKMPRHPDMILQFAHHLEKRWLEDGYPGIRVFADVKVSLNGRPVEHLVNRDVDLTAKRRSLAPADWLNPLRTPLRKESVISSMRQVLFN